MVALFAIWNCATASAKPQWIICRKRKMFLFVRFGKIRHLEIIKQKEKAASL